MYQKIKNSLFFPKEIATSYKDKVIGFIIFLILLATLPFVLYICVNGIITSDDIRNVKLAFYESPIVEYRIENNTLVSNTTTAHNRYLVSEENTIGIAFIGNEAESLEVSEQYVISFQDDGVYLVFPYINATSFKLSTYEKLEGINFEEAKTLENNEFWQTMLLFVDEVMDSIKFIVYPSAIIVVLVQMIGKILFGILINTIILLMFERTTVVKFKEVFKNTSVAFFPYIIGVILAYAFNLGILMNVGNIIAFIYALIAHNEYRRIKIKENM